MIQKAPDGLFPLWSHVFNSSSHTVKYFYYMYKNHWEGRGFLVSSLEDLSDQLQIATGALLCMEALNISELAQIAAVGRTKTFY